MGEGEEEEERRRMKKMKRIGKERSTRRGKGGEKEYGGLGAWEEVRERGEGEAGRKK